MTLSTRSQSEPVASAIAGVNAGQRGTPACGTSELPSPATAPARTDTRREVAGQLRSKTPVHPYAFHAGWM
jgi:hypothetical protein